MSYVNCGAFDTELGKRFKTKAALKRAVFQTPHEVLLDATAMGDTRRVTAAQLAQNGDTNNWSVVGPDPYTNRKWYATITVNRQGNLKVT